MRIPGIEVSSRIGAELGWRVAVGEHDLPEQRLAIFVPPALGEPDEKLLVASEPLPVLIRPAAARGLARGGQRGAAAPQCRRCTRGDDAGCYSRVLIAAWSHHSTVAAAGVNMAAVAT
jgi:hypothetical protein